MKLADWVSETRTESERLDIFWQIVRLLENGKGRGYVSPTLYEVNDANDVTYVGLPQDERKYDEFCKAFAAPELPDGAKPTDKSDVFSAGMLLCFILENETPKVIRTVSQNPFRKARRFNDGSVVRAKDSKAISLLMERMTSYDPTPRPTLRQVTESLNDNICKFGIILENELSQECHKEITRSFASCESYKFIPENEYVINWVTVAPLSVEPILIPFRLIKKQYKLKVAYSSEGRWSNAVKKSTQEVSAKSEVAFVRADIDDSLVAKESDEPNLSNFKYSPETLKAARTAQSALTIPRTTAALCYCDAVYGVDGDALFCESDGYTYEMGFYEYKRRDNNKTISIVREGSIAVPERLEARILSILREAEKAVYDMFCVGVYGNLSPDVIKTLNDTFPEAVRIYRLSDDDLLEGEALYRERQSAEQRAADFDNYESQGDSVTEEVML
ncbi:MAG: hypothetical protein FWG45_02765 [Oscillospiraceae bacterium]|nr:hypothetical protein [Oscillospiraceae bacterium]